jgi:hypothetical protein
MSPYVAVKLIHLNAPGVDVSDFVLQKPFALLACRVQHIQDGVFGQAGYAGNGVDAHAFKKQGNDLRGFGSFNAHSLERLSLAEGGVTLEASEALDAVVTVLIEAGLFDRAGAAMTVQACLSKQPELTYLPYLRRYAAHGSSRCFELRSVVLIALRSFVFG